MGLPHFFSANSRNTHFLKRYVRIKIEEHKILILISEPLNSTIKTGTHTAPYLPSECVRNIRNRFVSNTLARQISCRARSRFYSWVLRIPQCWCNSFLSKNVPLSFTTNHTPQICLPQSFCIPKIEVRPERLPICGYWDSSTECSLGTEGNSTSRLRTGHEGLGSIRTMVYQRR